MKKETSMLKSLKLSLVDIAGAEYVEKVIAASACLTGKSIDTLREIAEKKVDFFPEEVIRRLDDLIPLTGNSLSPALSRSSAGAGTAAFNNAFHRENAPLTGWGFFRIGEDGKLAVIGKSEHYQASCGHNFPGYQLLSHAMELGITNITHNNTRGHITRLLERELIRIANGISPGDEEALEEILKSTSPHVLNRVINLETGSLACEAAFKMMLGRFYKLQTSFPPPPYAGKIPVFLVMADLKEGKEANYHGTTVMLQMLRGMWPEMYSLLESAGAMKCVPVRINDKDSFAKAVAEYDTGKFKVAGFIHELVLMNYGGIRLDNDYVDFCHRLCDEHDIPVFVDEIQSCMWSGELFLFKEYGCKPDFVSVGKGFPGGMYPASKILTTSVMDNLNQFGALVTNGQEELASLAYLITIRFAEHNADHTRKMGEIWQQKLHALAATHSNFVARAEGDGLLGTLFFHNADQAVLFCRELNGGYHIDVSAQTYKADCPPAALTKFPLIVSEKMLCFAAEAMEKIFLQMERETK